MKSFFLAAAFVSLPVGVGVILVMPLVDALFLPESFDRIQAIAALAAAVTAIATSVGVCLLYFTLKYTRETLEQTRNVVEQAQRTTQAAYDANAIMRDEQRAWVKIKEMSWRFEERTDQGWEMPKLRGGIFVLSLENIGKSTAQSVHLQMAETTLQNLTDQPSTLVDGFYQLSPAPKQTTLFPGECLEEVLFMPSSELLSNGTRHEPHLAYLKMRIQYRTSDHSELQQTIQCFQAKFINRRGQRPGAPSGWDISHLPILRDVT